MMATWSPEIDSTCTRPASAKRSRTSPGSVRVSAMSSARAERDQWRAADARSEVRVAHERRVPGRHEEAPRDDHVAPHRTAPPHAERAANAAGAETDGRRHDGAGPRRLLDCDAPPAHARQSRDAPGAIAGRSP